ncbi:type II secretion system F family protein [Jatrophihabitans telluris]|uniref:Type II secretion system F family protein n=1 Tax=Jatrophihabitans telluris TaxID=2038343 RepID=A0ABY4QY46_9ACTN|nr:type II secretion system F family protein [Jatrophihabitans telluris]UQX88147.1 type II secretion system F family protein [Jatrophihabitans telluris]
MTTTLLTLTAALLLLPKGSGRRRWALRAVGSDPAVTGAAASAAVIPERGRRAARVMTVLAVLAPLGLAGSVASGPIALAVGGLAGLCAAVGFRRLHARSARPEPLADWAVAAVLELTAAVVQSGAPVDRALLAVADAVDRAAPGARHRLPAIDVLALQRAIEPFRLVGRLLRLGAEPRTAWSALFDDDGLAGVATAAIRCAQSGARLAGALRAEAARLRSKAELDAVVRARRSGVWTLLPLGLCQLPAFLCLGVLPVVIGVAGPAWNGVAR